jgi:hypothetical protein
MLFIVSVPVSQYSVRLRRYLYGLFYRLSTIWRKTTETATILVLTMYFLPGTFEHTFMVMVKEVNLSLWLISYTARHEDIFGNGDIAPPFLTSALYGGEWLASRLGPLTPGKEPPVPIGQEAVWTGLEGVESRKCLATEVNRTPPANSQAVAVPTVLSHLLYINDIYTI